LQKIWTASCELLHLYKSSDQKKTLMGDH